MNETVRINTLPVLVQLAWLHATEGGNQKPSVDDMAAVSSSLLIGLELALAYPEWAAAVVATTGPFKRPDMEHLALLVEILPCEAQS